MHQFHPLLINCRPLATRASTGASDCCLGRSVINNHSQAGNGLAKGRITVYSSLVAANAFVRRVRRTGTFARSGSRTMRKHSCVGIGNARHISPSKVSLPVGDLHLI